MDIQTRLQELFEQHHQALAAYAWASEDDRWAELIYCLLQQCSEQEPEAIRGLVATLQSLALLNPAVMTRLRVPADEYRVVWAYVLKQHGFGAAGTEQACSVLSQLAAFVQSQYGGKFQRYLRRHGEMIREELVSMLDSAGLDKSRLVYAVSHWLQNALSLPVSLQHAAVTAFCAEQDASFEEVLAAGDALNLNTALVDDLLQLAYGAPEPARPAVETVASR